MITDKTLEDIGGVIWIAAAVLAGVAFFNWFFFEDGWGTILGYLFLGISWANSLLRWVASL